MKIVFDCRWHKKSGIGTFADNTLKNMLKTENEFLLLGFNSLPEEFSASLSETSPYHTVLRCALLSVPYPFLSAVSAARQ